MNNKRSLSYFSTSCFLAGILLYGTAFAGDANEQPAQPNIFQQLQQLLGKTDTNSAVKNLIAGYGENMTEKYLNKPTPGLDFLVTYSKGFKEVLMPANQSALIPYANPEKKGDSLDRQATGDIVNATGMKIQSIQNYLSCPVPGQSRDTYVKPAGNGCDSTMDTPESLGNYDIWSLLGPLRYRDAKAAQTAQNYIQFATSLSQPYDADIAALRGKSKASSANLLSYVTAVRSYAAAQSAGINNLNHAYVQRVPIPGLGSKTGIAKEDNAAASPLEVDAYTANRRVSDPDWYKKMDAASPATVARETLYVLAEMRQEMFKMRMEIERLQMVTSLLQLQMGRQAATTMDLPKAQEKAGADVQRERAEAAQKEREEQARQEKARQDNTAQRTTR